MKFSRPKFSLKSFFSNSVVRWWIVGLFFTFVNIPLLYLFVDLWKMQLWAATFLTSELITLVRFVVNDYWVFGHPYPTWKRLWQYHVANASSFLIWWAAANALPKFGINYLIASVLATGISVGWSMITNFLWIWKPKGSKQKAKANRRTSALGIEPAKKRRL